MEIPDDHFRHILKRIIMGDEKWVVRKIRLCWVFGGISKVLIILSCSQGTKLSITMSTVASYWNWTKKSRKSSRNWQLVKVLSSTKITPDHKHLWSLAKNYWSYAGKWCLIHRTVLTLHHPIIIYFVHFKIIWMDKHSIEMRLSKMSWFSFCL